MRLLSLAFVALLVLIQYPLWLGKGGWLRVWELERQIDLQARVNARLIDRNSALAEEVRDLQEGTGAIEERARYELGMMRSDEIFVQVAEPVAGGAVVTPPVGPARISVDVPNSARTVR